MSRDYDKPKKSWREIDQNKDRSSHRPGERPTGNPFKQARADSASKVYKSKLDNFFDGDGKVPDHVKEKFEALDSSKEGKERKKAISKIKDAKSSSSKTAAIADFLKKWELPPDYDVLTEVLSCSDDEYIEMALNEIEKMFAANRPPKRTSVLEQKFRSIISLGEEPHIQDKAKALLKQLRLFK